MGKASYACGRFPPDLPLPLQSLLDRRRPPLVPQALFPSLLHSTGILSHATAVCLKGPPPKSRHISSNAQVDMYKKRAASSPLPTQRHVTVRGEEEEDFFEGDPGFRLISAVAALLGEKQGYFDCHVCSTIRVLYVFPSNVSLTHTFTFAKKVRTRL